MGSISNLILLIVNFFSQSGVLTELFYSFVTIYIISLWMKSVPYLTVLSVGNSSSAIIQNSVPVEIGCAAPASTI